MAEVAHRLRDEPNLLFLMSNGQAKNDLEAEVVRRRLLNVRFMDFQDRDRLSEVQATADLRWSLSLRAGADSVPSKVIGYMARDGRSWPVCEEGSDTANCVLAGPCGVITPPNDAGAIADVIAALKHDPKRREQLGAAARSQFESGYAAPAVLKRYADMLIDVVRDRDRTLRAEVKSNSGRFRRQMRSVFHELPWDEPRQPGADRTRPTMLAHDVPRVVEIHQAALRTSF